MAADKKPSGLVLDFRIPQIDELIAQLQQTNDLLRQQSSKETTMLPIVQDIQAELAKVQATARGNTSLIQSIVVTQQGTAAVIASLTAQLAAAIANIPGLSAEDTTALQGVVAGFEVVNTSLAQDAQTYAESAVANTPAAVGA